MIDRNHALPITRHVATLMQRMGIEAQAPQRGTSKRALGHDLPVPTAQAGYCEINDGA